jgi:uncharacterized protein
MGQLIKIIIIMIGVSVLLLALRRWLGGRNRDTEAQHANAVQSMVQCAHCGMYTPESQAISEGTHYYCNDAHRRLGANKQ